MFRLLRLGCYGKLLGKRRLTFDRLKEMSQALIKATDANLGNLNGRGQFSETNARRADLAGAQSLSVRRGYGDEEGQRDAVEHRKR